MWKTTLHFNLVFALLFSFTWQLLCFIIILYYSIESVQSYVKCKMHFAIGELPSVYYYNPRENDILSLRNNAPSSLGERAVLFNELDFPFPETLTCAWNLIVIGRARLNRAEYRLLEYYNMLVFKPYIDFNLICSITCLVSYVNMIRL